MEVIALFSLARHDGPYESWPLETEVLKGGAPTGRRLPGFILDAQFQHGDFYVFVTSWDCLSEESLEIILTDLNLRVLDRKSVGAMYSSTWFESSEVLANGDLLLHCDGNLPVNVALSSHGLQVEHSVPGSHDRQAETVQRSSKSPWWKLW